MFQDSHDLQQKITELEQVGAEAPEIRSRRELMLAVYSVAYQMALLRESLLQPIIKESPPPPQPVGIRFGDGNFR